MKPTLHEVEKMQREDGTWVWLCTDNQRREWATYISREPDPEDTLHGNYFWENEAGARKDFQRRQESDYSSSSRKSPSEDLQLLDTEYADIIANSPHPDVEINLRQCGNESEEARRQTQWLTVLSREPKTQEEEKRWIETWEEVTGRALSEQEFLKLYQLLWGN
ncbi:MAG: hypothetical protein ACOC04_06600 [Halothece sp.]